MSREFNLHVCEGQEGKADGESPRQQTGFVCPIERCRRHDMSHAVGGHF
jgi:hypothetical protein